MNYTIWALIGMVSYSLVPLLVKLATRSGQLSTFIVLVIATVIVAVTVLSIVILNGELKILSATDFTRSSALYAYATGIALTLAVSSFFQALSLGPASVVVPIYGMFIVGGSILGIFILDEPVTIRKLIGIGLAAISVLFIAGRS